MKLIDYLNNINKERFTVRKDRWFELKQYYISMYSFNMLIFYDKGYIADPTRFSEIEILRNLVELDIYDLHDKVGNIMLKSEYVDFARRRNKKNSEKWEFLDILYRVLKYREYCIELDKQFELGDTKVKFNFILNNSCLVKSYSMVDYNKGVFNTIIEGDTSLRYISFHDTVYEFALKELGIGASEKGVFVRGLSLEEEVKFCNLILEGSVLLDGKYGKVLSDWLDKNTKNGEGLYYFILKKYVSEISGVISTKVDELGDSFLLLYEDKIYYKVKAKGYNLPISMFVSVSTIFDNDLIEDKWSCLYGYSGEAYTVGYLAENNINYIGIPVTTYVNGQSQVVYGYNQLVLPVDTNSWFSSEAIFEFNEEFTMANPYKEGTPEHIWVEAYISGVRGEIYRVDADQFDLKTLKSARKGMLSRFVKSLKQIGD